ncbi:hypothetical protein [Streptomyces sp. DH10]|uniref:hypothetical protein n=1 Tax=Streptomyces sp. DH10 TaxID=3040121 RepID=UPI0024410540|nr:hypothetical protein [Streptomyces sp. DH10]MDG9709514.1 hypothetical protein [Streptomyces sp. DH10]
MPAPRFRSIHSGPAPGRKRRGRSIVGRPQFAQPLAKEELRSTAAGSVCSQLGNLFGAVAPAPKARLVRGLVLRHRLRGVISALPDEPPLRVE